MASDRKIIVKILDDLSPSDIKLRNLSRPPEGLNNMFINEKGQVEQRQGYSQYNQTTLNSSHPIIGIHRFYNEEDNSKEFLVACYNKLYKLDDSHPHAGTELSSNEGI